LNSENDAAHIKEFLMREYHDFLCQVDHDHNHHHEENHNEDEGSERSHHHKTKTLVFSFNEIMENGLREAESQRIIFNLFHSMSDLITRNRIHDFILSQPNID